jgi:hypothetical protein
LAAVVAYVIDMPAFVRLEDGLADGHRQQIVVAGLDLIEAFDKHSEGPLNAKVDDDTPPNRLDF